MKDEEVHFAGAGNGYMYTVASRPPAGVGEKTTPDEKYLALPKSLDPRVRELAKQVVGADNDPMRVAQKLESYLRSGYSYTLELPGELDEPLSDFLFVQKAGHCEHFATALAVFLRTQGIAARVTAGFFGGERVNESFVVRAGDAHAWVQAFIPNRGWVTFDATPESGRRSNSSAWLATLTTYYEKLEQLWQSRVVDYSIQDQVQIVRALVRAPSEAGEKTSLSFTRVPKRALIAGALVALIVLVVVRTMLRPSPKRPHPLASFLDDIEQRLDRAKIERAPGEGLEELSARLTALAHPLARPLARASKRYLEARFGQKALTKQERAKLLSALNVVR